jgi:Glycosyl transferase family 2
MIDLTLICPYYRQPLILREQLRHWVAYPEGFHFALVDDGSPEPAKAVVEECPAHLKRRIELYRITVDQPWNRGGARNLASWHCRTKWLVHLDIDHLLPVACAEALLAFRPQPRNWYRFERYRVGRADATRQKDQLDPMCEFGKIHPHIDSYLCTKEMYWQGGGYDERYSGCLGGGTPFLAELAKVGGEAKMLPGSIHLHVYTTHAVSDASVMTLSRDRSEYAKRKRLFKGKGQDPLRLPWIKEPLCIPP